MDLTDQDIFLFHRALKAASEYDFSDYSEKSLSRRLTKVLADHKIDINKLIIKIKSDKDFTEQIVKEITVNTTELFRDPAMWQNLRYKVLPRYKYHTHINILHAGCSTGQEVYSMMILLHELGLLEKSRIFATDINADVLHQASKGIYRFRFNIGYLDNFNQVIKENPFNFDDYHDVPYEKYFHIVKDKDMMIMHNYLTRKPAFKKQDLTKGKNPFYKKFDIIFCRNVMIYFNANLQNKVTRFFYENMFDEGHLILGKQETIRGGFMGSFDKQWDFYVKRTNKDKVEDA